MRTRAVSAIAIVLVGLVPIVAGGPIFTLLMLALGTAGFREYLALARRTAAVLDSAKTTRGAALASPTVQSLAMAPQESVASDVFHHSVGNAQTPTALVGYGSIAALALAALLNGGAALLFVAVAFAVVGSLVVAMGRSPALAPVVSWTLVVTGSLYIGLPVYAAIALRAAAGPIESAWLSSLAEGLPLAWDSTPRGLAWTLAVVLVIWTGDTTAYLIGRRYGRRQLAPQLSPNKTIEGAIGGLIGATIVGAIAVAAFGVGIWPVGVLAGALLGVAGQCGDLSESWLKRQAGVKDSGSLLPGHGGVLDRIDALLFAFPTGYLLASMFDRVPAG